MILISLLNAASASPPPVTPQPGDEVQFSDDPLEHSSISAALMTGIIITWLILGHKIQDMFEWTQWVSEGSMACILGIFSGVGLLIFDHFNEQAIRRSLSFSSATFFTYMLPPIIFYGGLAIRRKLFVSNLISIIAFGVLGTFISFVLLGTTLYWLSMLPNVLRFSDCLALAAIFAATDSVAVLSVLRPEAHPALYSIILGEGVMNDATSVALLRSVGKLQSDADLSMATALTLGAYFTYLFAASFAVGLGGGLSIALIMKRLGPFSEPQEISLVGAVAFLTYQLAEIFNLSGILALFFCGMAVSHYALQHVSKPSRTALINFFRTLSYLLEGIIFLYVGRDTLDPSKWSHAHFLETQYIVIFVVALIAVSRALFVFPLAWLHNRWSTQPLFFGDGVVIWWAGMMRGAVSVAMVYYRFDPSNTAEDGHASTIVVMTLQVVLLSTIVLGGVTGPLIKLVLNQTASRATVASLSTTTDAILAQGYFPQGGTSDRSDRGPDDNPGSDTPNSAFDSPRQGTRSNVELTMYPSHSTSTNPFHREESRAGGLNSVRRQVAPTLDRRALLDPIALSSSHNAGMTSESPPPATSSYPSSGQYRPARPSPEFQAARMTTAPVLLPTREGELTSSTVDYLGREDMDATGMKRVAMMGRRVLSAAYGLAEMTAFEQAEGQAPSADGALGDRMYSRFQEFDAKYMQPTFGAEGISSLSPVGSLEAVVHGAPGYHTPVRLGSASRDNPLDSDTSG